MIKKKLIISTYDDLTNPYYGGGGAIAIHKVALGLQKWYDIIVLTSRHTNFKDVEKIAGVTYKRIGWTPEIFPQLGQLIFVWLLPFYAKKMKYDLWLESFTPPYSVSFLPLFTAKPVLGIAHFIAGKESSRKYKLPFEVIEKLGMKLYDHCIAPSMATSQRLKAIASQVRVATIPNGVDLPLNTKQSNEKIIGYLGRIDIKNKGLDTLITSFAKLPKKTGWKLLIAGTGIKSELKLLQKMIAAHNIQDRVEVIGYISGTSKLNFYKSVQIVAVLSLSETFSISALEALAAGKTVIWTDIPGLEWIPAHAGIKVPVSSVKHTTAALKKIISSDELREVARKVGRKTAKALSWENTVQKYHEVIETLV